MEALRFRIEASKCSSVIDLLHTEATRRLTSFSNRRVFPRRDGLAGFAKRHGLKCLGSVCIAPQYLFNETTINIFTIPLTCFWHSLGTIQGLLPSVRSYADLMDQIRCNLTGIEFRYDLPAMSAREFA
jgi:hypothetical protein